MDDSSANLHHQAIEAALTLNWEEAVRINKEIIEVEPKSVEALNRLGRAYFELGDLEPSKKNFENALENDPYNQIASKFLKRIETFSKKGSKNKILSIISPSTIDGDMFIEEPGKTKLVTLLKVAEPQKLSLLSAGTLVSLTVKNRGISALDQRGEYLGVLPDDISHHLIRLIKGGNKYQAIIKTIKTNGLSILVREIYRSSRFKNQPSFLDASAVAFAYSSDHIVVSNDDEEAMIESYEEEDSA